MGQPDEEQRALILNHQERLKPIVDTYAAAFDVPVAAEDEKIPEGQEFEHVPTCLELVIRDCLLAFDDLGLDPGDCADRAFQLYEQAQRERADGGD